MSAPRETIPFAKSTWVAKVMPVSLRRLLLGPLQYAFYNTLLNGSFGFPFCGERVFFPRSSPLIKRVAVEGLFETHNVQLMCALAVDGSVVYDIGANIGLMALPVLRMRKTVMVVSFEPSPNSLPYLRKTWEASSVRDRWVLVPEAAGASKGRVTMRISRPELGAFDGIADTERVPVVGSVEVNMRTIDEDWANRGYPPVSVIKVDVEGYEMDVLRGAKNCIDCCKPWILTEVFEQNWKAHGKEGADLLEFAQDTNYAVFAVPSLVKVDSQVELKMHMALTYDFLLMPNA